LALGPFAFFGGTPGQKLPALEAMKVARHSKGNAQGIKAERPQIRIVPRSQFERPTSLDDLIERLFGQVTPQGLATRKNLELCPRKLRVSTYPPHVRRRKR
jgi:hypothetical protein